MILETDGKKNGCHGAEQVMPVGAYRITVQKCVWTNLKEEYGSWKGIDFKSFYEDGHAQ